jgi:putative ATP-binding cassette transporter
LCLPDGREIVCADRLTIEAGTTTLVSGPSGSGKSTLFRAISGIWPYGRGTIDRPADATVMLLPQRPYVPSGTLKTAVAYPSVVGAYTDKAVREALELARLAPLACEIDSEDNWPQRLSGGEQSVWLSRGLFSTSRTGCSSTRRHRRLTRSWKRKSTAC